MNYKKIAKQTPSAIGGLALALASLGNVFINFRFLFGLMVLVLLGLITNKLIFDLETIKEEIKSPGAGINSTWTMTLSVYSTYFKNIFQPLAVLIWAIGVILHLYIIVMYSKTMFTNFQIKNVHPSAASLFVGFSVNAFIAPQYGYITIGKILFLSGVISFIIVIPLYIYRQMQLEILPRPLFPTVAILSSPASVLLNGYIVLYRNNLSMFVFWLLFVLTILLWLYVLLQLPRIIKNSFYPSYSALTFPLVITAVALKAAGSVREAYIIKLLATTSLIIALLFVVLVSILFVNNLVLKRR